MLRLVAEYDNKVVSTGSNKAYEEVNTGIEEINKNTLLDFKGQN